MEELLTAKDLSKLWHLNEKTIYKWVSRREIPFVRLPGHTTRFKLTEIQEWLDKRTSKGKALEKGIYL